MREADMRHGRSHKAQSTCRCTTFRRGPRLGELTHIAFEARSISSRKNFAWQITQLYFRRKPSTNPITAAAKPNATRPDSNQ